MPPKIQDPDSDNDSDQMMIDNPDFSNTPVEKRIHPEDESSIMRKRPRTENSIEQLKRPLLNEKATPANLNKTLSESQARSSSSTPIKQKRPLPATSQPSASIPPKSGASKISALFGASKPKPTPAGKIKTEFAAPPTPKIEPIVKPQKTHEERAKEVAAQKEREFAELDRMKGQKKLNLMKQQEINQNYEMVRTRIREIRFKGTESILPHPSTLGAVFSYCNSPHPDT